MKFYLQGKTVWGIPDERYEKEVRIPLIKIKKSYLQKLRDSATPCLILKTKGYQSSLPAYYYCNLSTLEKNHIDFDGFHHLCRNCRYLSALPDEQDGCAKVRAIGEAKKLEDFQFILMGIETHNFIDDVFLVTSCIKHVKVPQFKRK